MACTTILVGKNASYDGSTMIARNDDSGSGSYTAKKFQVVHPEQQPRVYKTVLSHLEMQLPDNPMRYTCMPNAVVEKEGIWAACGVNEVNVGMTATETITTNARVLGADPLVKPDKDVAGGIGEEDIVLVTLPYIHSAREGVERLGALLEQYGTYESNGIAFSDVNEIWFLETIGGHHWMAKRVPDDQYVMMPNQLGIDSFDFEDAMGNKENHMCSSDLEEFVKKNHLDLSLNGDEFSPRAAFGSHDDSDHVYNTPRAWYMGRYFNPTLFKEKQYTPVQDDLPWSLVPEKKITVEDIKYILSSHYQGTEYDPYGSYGDERYRGMYRSIGINRNDFLGLIQIRPYMPEAFRTLQWIAEGSNAFNAMAPFYTNVHTVPAYLGNTTAKVSTDNFYWSNRLIGALANASYGKSIMHIERYQLSVASKANAIVHEFDEQLLNAWENEDTLCEKANEAVSEMLQKETDEVLNKVLYEASNVMKNGYSRSDN